MLMLFINYPITELNWVTPTPAVIKINFVASLEVYRKGTKQNHFRTERLIYFFSLCNRHLGFSFLDYSFDIYPDIKLNRIQSYEKVISQKNNICCRGGTCKCYLFAGVLKWVEAARQHPRTFTPLNFLSFPLKWIIRCQPNQFQYFTLNSKEICLTFYAPTTEENCTETFITTETLYRICCDQLRNWLLLRWSSRLQVSQHDWPIRLALTIWFTYQSTRPDYLNVFVKCTKRLSVV